MQKKHHMLLYTFLSLALVAAVGTAVYQGQRAVRVSRALEDVYYSAVLESISQLQSMEVKMNKLLVSGTPQTGVTLLSDLSRQAGEVQNNLTILPLSHSAMEPTVKFASQVGDYTNTLVLKVANGTPLNDTDIQQISQLLANCVLLSGQLQAAQQQMIAQSMRYTAENPVFYEDMSAQARPMEQVGDKDKGIDYPTMIYDGAFSDARHMGAPQGLPQGDVTKEQALEIAKAFVGTERVTGVIEAAAIQGAIPAWGVTVTIPDDTITVEVTRQGGKVLWMMPERAEFTQTLSVDQCKEKAKAFLLNRGFGEMLDSYYQVYNGLAVINYAAVQDNVLLYPDLVKVQVRMDTGDIVGFEGNNYWMNHRQRELEKPKVTEAEARDMVSSRLEILQTRLCVIPFRGTEKLCYEFSATWDNSQYLVYIDALTGEETDILKVIESETGPLAA
jgi:germination protein YpeB